MELPVSEEPCNITAEGKCYTNSSPTVWQVPMVACKSISRLSSWMTTPSRSSAGTMTFPLFKALSDKDWPAEEGWRKDDADHSPFWRGQILYLTLWIQLRENAERCLWETRVSFTYLLVQDKLLIPFHEGQPALVAMQKLRGHLFHTRPVNALHWIVRGLRRVFKKIPLESFTKISRP